MSDGRWFEIDAAIAAATRHFAGALLIFERLSSGPTDDDRYLIEMGFLHAMQAGHTSLESALLRILDLFSETPPSGSAWHADLIKRVSNPVGERPAILRNAVAGAADKTRRFRSVAAHAYDSFDATLAADALASAALLAERLQAEIHDFRQKIDP